MNTKLQELLGQGINRHGTVWFSPRVALAIIDELELLQVPLYGVEAACFMNNKDGETGITPDMSLIGDFGDAPTAKQNYDVARQLVANAPQDRLWDLVFDESAPAI